MKTVYDEYLGAEPGELAVVGDFEPSEVLPLVEKARGRVDVGEGLRTDRGAVPEAVKGSRMAIETPDKANAVYMAGLPMPFKDDDPDYPALMVGNLVLGGGVVVPAGRPAAAEGRPVVSAASMFNASPIDEHASLLLYAIYNPVNVEKVVDGAMDEVAKLLKEGVKPEELERAKKGLLQQYQIGRTSDRSLVGTLANHLFIDRTFQYQADLEAAIEALTPEAVDAALRKHLTPDGFAVVTAGDFAGSKKAAETKEGAAGNE